MEGSCDPCYIVGDDNEGITKIQRVAEIQEHIRTKTWTGKMVVESGGRLQSSIDILLDDCVMHRV